MSAEFNDILYSGLLLTMSKFFISLSSSKSSNIIVLFFSQIMGMYFMSMVVLMRMNMPVRIFFKGTVNVISSATPFKELHTRFTTILALGWGKFIIFKFLTDSFSGDREENRQNLFLFERKNDRIFLIDIHKKGSNGTFVNLAFNSVSVESLEITLIVRFFYSRLICSLCLNRLTPS